MREHPASRGLWTGTISFGLVSIPIELYVAQRRAAPGLRLLSPELVPLRREFYCPADDQTVAGDELARGYEVGHKMITITDEELEALAPRSSRDIELTQFVDQASIDPIYFERAYFLAPAGESSKAYRLLAETMERTHRAGIARFVMRGQEYLVAIFAEKGILRAETLRRADEVRDVAGIDVDKKKVDPAPARAGAKCRETPVT